MLVSLSISNYALINTLEINFNKGLNVITGETGAGKSILLGALSLILGQRADAAVLRDKEKKCVVEGIFDISNFDFREFYKNLDIDYEERAILRREISPQGKSRAFINDTPVNLSDLKDLAQKLTDIHSQHKNPELNDLAFQLMMIDAVAGLQTDVKEYKTIYKQFRELKLKYADLLEKSENAAKELDFLQFRHEELAQAKLSENEQADLEEELINLTHAEDIKRNLTEASNILSTEQSGVLSRLKTAYSALSKISVFHKKSEDFASRIEAALIDLKETAGEIDYAAEKIEFDAQRIEFLTKRLDLIYVLQKKHQAESVSQLLVIQKYLQERINEISSFEFSSEELRKEISETTKILSEKAQNLSSKRKIAFRKVQEQIGAFLNDMGMPSAQFYIQHTQTEDYTESGTDRVSFMFSANKTGEPSEIAKVASGGEISRLMLSIKALTAESVKLPTVIFDEIDTGVSGEIAGKMGEIMRRMARNMQVIDITHLPQIAAKADFHYIVYKTENETETESKIKLLEVSERITEIAKMLSGEKVTDAALENAKDLLKL